MPELDARWSVAIISCSSRRRGRSSGSSPCSRVRGPTPRARSAPASADVHASIASAWTQRLGQCARVRRQDLRPPELRPVHLFLDALERGIADGAVGAERDDAPALRVRRGAEEVGIGGSAIGRPRAARPASPGLPPPAAAAARSCGGRGRALRGRERRRSRRPARPAAPRRARSAPRARRTRRRARRRRIISGRRVRPCRTSVPSTTPNAVTRIRSRCGNGGDAAAARGQRERRGEGRRSRACRTTRRRPRTGGRAPAVRTPAGRPRRGRHHQRLSAAAPVTHAMRATITDAVRPRRRPPRSARPSVRVARLDDRLQLEADEDEREHVQDEHRDLPHRPRGDADARGRRSPAPARRRHREDHDGDDAGQVQALGEDPHRERAAELDHDRGADVGDARVDRRGSPASSTSPSTTLPTVTPRSMGNAPSRDEVPVTVAPTAMR